MTDSSDDVPDLPSGTLVGSRYRLERVLGRGAAGTVYAATGPDGEKVAVKTVWSLHDGGASSQRLSRFLRESRVASALVSEHIVPVLDGGVDEEHGVAFSAMPLLTGEDASALVKRLGALSPAVAVRIALQACAGLAVAHAAGVVHRDIKPANLFLAREGSALVVKICDFGVAKTSASTLNLTAPGTTLGSPLYMSPEQVTNAKTVDTRADVWSLAMTLYELLAGKAAYSQVSTFPELVLAMTRPMTSVQELAPWVDPGLALAVHGALLRDVELRCPSVEALQSALLPYSAGSTELTEAMLRPVDGRRRQQAAARIELPGSWEQALGALDATAAVSQSASSAPVTRPPQMRGDDPQQLIGQVLAERYQLERLLGKGGMGAVYEAIDLRDRARQRYAVKVVIGAERDADTLRRFLREARAAREIQSEHVVRVFDAETDSEYGLPFIVMELLQGEDLSGLLKASGPLDPAATCRLFVQACQGLAAAHAKGVVHRDIKPANIFLHQLPSGELTVKICDFGVAKQTGVDIAQTSELTQTGGMVGSPMYMSPEQARSAKHVDHRTDIWSLAISLHQALSGQKPWAQSGSLGELILSICTADMVPLQDLAPWIPPALADVVHRGIRRDPGERYASIDDFARALEPFAARVTSLTHDALVHMTESTRNTVAPRATGFGASQITSSSSGTSISTAPTAPVALAPLPVASPRNPLLLPVGVFAAVTGVGLAAVVALRPTPAPAPAATVIQREVVTVVSVQAPTAAPTASSSRVAGKLLIKGSPTRLSVNGTPRELGPGGEVALEGQPGDVFFIELEVGKVKRGPEKVTLSRDGSLSPAELVVVGGPPSGSPAAAAVRTAAPPVTAAVTRTPPSTPTAQGTVKPREEF